jgi:hypothetical protein
MGQHPMSIEYTQYCHLVCVAQVWQKLENITNVFNTPYQTHE